jgi:hypothetical protein
MNGTSVDLKDYDIKKIIEDKNYLNIRKRVEIKVFLSHD